MKVVFIFNFYNSFKHIIKNNKLSIIGNVTLIKIIKKISIKNKVRVYLIEKNKDSKLNQTIKTKIDNIEFLVIPFKKKFILQNFILLFKEFYFGGIKTFYIDRGNIFFAYIIKVFTKNNVIIRILGITKAIEDSLAGHNVLKYFNRIIWKKKYDLIINSNDGSNYKSFCINKMSIKNKYLTLNQSIDKFQKIKIKKNKFHIILCDNFSSIYKNFHKVLETLKFIEPHIKKKLKLIFIYSNEVEKNEIKKNTISFNDVNLIPRQSNQNLLKQKFNCDALITFNSMGYLSNNILESIYCNNWIITPLYSKLANNIPKEFKKYFIFLNKDNLKIEINKKIKILMKKNKKINFNNIFSNLNKIEKEYKLLRSMKLIK